MNHSPCRTVNGREPETATSLYFYFRLVCQRFPPASCQTFGASRWVVLRAELFIIIPVHVVYLFLFGTRDTLARNLALEDLPSSAEILLEDDSFEQLESLLVGERDRND